MHGSRPFVRPCFLSLCGLSEGFVTDRILISVFVSGQRHFSLVYSFDCLKEKYFNMQTVKFMLQKPVIFTNSYITEANQLVGHPSSKSMGFECFLARGKSRRGMNLIILAHIVPKLKWVKLHPHFSHMPSLYAHWQLDHDLYLLCHWRDV